VLQLAELFGLSSTNTIALKLKNQSDYAGELCTVGETLKYKQHLYW
jgi:hypothetical protein